MSPTLISHAGLLLTPLQGQSVNFPLKTVVRPHLPPMSIPDAYRLLFRPSRLFTRLPVVVFMAGRTTRRCPVQSIPADWMDWTMENGGSKHDHEHLKGCSAEYVLSSV
jgi:hypothetical protein